MRKPISSLVAIGLVLVVTLTGGCVITETPLSDPAPSDADKRLYGRWRADDENGYTTLEFAPPTDATPKFRGTGDQKIMVVTFARYAKDGREPLGGTLTERAFITTIVERTFLNIYDEQERGFRINRYRIDGDTLDTWSMDTNAMANAIRNGDLPAGEVSYDRGSVNRVRITRPLKEYPMNETRDKLRSLLTGKSSEDIFPESSKRRYTRIKDKK